MVQTRKTAGWLAGELSREGHQVALLSGEMQVEQRAAVIERFRDGKEKVLVTTNVCARGKRQNQDFESFASYLMKDFRVMCLLNKTWGVLGDVHVGLSM